MKLPARLSVVFALSALVLSVVAGSSNVFAQSALTNDQQQRIKANCLSIKSTLNQLKATDALLRVNRGQIYEAMATKLMDRFNTRLSSNNLDATGTSLVTASYRKQLDTFRSDYSSYERLLVAAIGVDCTNQPAQFHAALELARSARDTVHKDVVRLHQYIDDYRSAVNDFLINYERVSGDN